MIRIADSVAAGSMRELRNQVTGEFASINRYVLVLISKDFKNRQFIVQMTGNEFYHFIITLIRFFGSWYLILFNAFNFSESIGITGLETLYCM